MKLPLTKIFFMHKNYKIINLKIVFVSLVLSFIYLLFKHNLSFNKYLSLDNLSVLILLLTLMIFLLMFSFKSKISIFFILLICLIFCFISNNLMMFYIFFELSVIPVVYSILKFGKKPERLEASILMIFYTMMGAFPLMFKLIYYYKLNMNLSLVLVSLVNYFFFGVYIFWLLCFLMKMPMYGFHKWLPKAHVEASVEGSMILAAIMLKLGSYGLVRMKKFMYMKLFFSELIIFFMFIGGFLGLFICFRQIDMKSIMAYSSVIHMLLVTVSLFIFSKYSFMGLVLMMVSHGFISSLMFFKFKVFYSTSNSRSLFKNSSLLLYFNLYVFFWVMVCVFKASMPPSFSLVAEIQMFSILKNLSSVWFFFVLKLILFTGIYNIYLYMNMGQGLNFILMQKFKEVNIKKFVLFVHCFYVMGFLFFLDYLF